MTTKRRESVFNKMAKMVTPLPVENDKPTLSSPRGKRSPRDNDINQEDLKVTAVEILKTSKKAGYLTKQGKFYKKKKKLTILKGGTIKSWKSKNK